MTTSSKSNFPSSRSICERYTLWDLFLLAQEVFHSMTASKSKQGWLILKLDIRKAFDTISWNFLTNILQAYNFPPEWINIIKSCLTEIDYTPILNGTKIDSLKPLRGTRQGSSLSTYLFILAMEYLSTMISNSVNLGEWKPFQIRNHDLKIYHLLFANDVLLFVKADSQAIDNIYHIIGCFCKTSGMQINLEKSKLWLSPHIPDY